MAGARYKSAIMSTEDLTSIVINFPAVLTTGKKPSAILTSKAGVSLQVYQYNKSYKGHFLCALGSEPKGNTAAKRSHLLKAFVRTLTLDVQNRVRINYADEYGGPKTQLYKKLFAEESNSLHEFYPIPQAVTDARKAKQAAKKAAKLIEMEEASISTTASSNLSEEQLKAVINSVLKSVKDSRSNSRVNSKLTLNKSKIFEPSFTAIDTEDEEMRQQLEKRLRREIEQE